MINYTCDCCGKSITEEEDMVANPLSLKVDYQTKQYMLQIRAGLKALGFGNVCRDCLQNIIHAAFTFYDEIVAQKVIDESPVIVPPVTPITPNNQ